MKPIFEIDVLINSSFGGFSLNDEIALWLQENRGWEIISRKDYDSTKNYPIKSLLDWHHEYILFPNKEMDDLTMRSHPDIIEAYKAIKKLHEHDDYPEKYYGTIHNFSIKRVSVYIDIENYYDGKEKINGWINSESIKI